MEPVDKIVKANVKKGEFIRRQVCMSAAGTAQDGNYESEMSK